MRLLVLSVLALSLGAASKSSAQSPPVPHSDALVQAVVQQITPSLEAGSVRVLGLPPETRFDSVVAQALSVTPAFRRPAVSDSVHARWAGTRGLRVQGDTARVMFQMRGCEKRVGMNYWRQTWELLFVLEDSVWRFVRSHPYDNADGVCGSNLRERKLAEPGPAMP